MAASTLPKHLKPNARMPTLRKDFPKLGKKSHDVTSNWDTDYNCIAFAAGITNQKIFPDYASAGRPHQRPVKAA